ncbi:PREDICTED: DUF724 domain-containing protein 1-like [Camelina sativa]|uniref:DUF724 domain-containing protein 1-like n=1 Tax=Camelina sativa TaxID=90675 RepID=A0ABM0WR22_CAMSA|nr:PREDICTED: DUF724 domain-containing protein 1-like [Camelina sativa]
MEQTIRKDCEVEICSEGDGLKIAWYRRAILEETPTSNTVSGSKTKLRVRYTTTMLNEDGSSPKTVEQRLIRPVPPANLCSSGVVLEEGSVVDADYKGRWWTGVLVKKMEDGRCLVYFDLLPDIVQFQTKQLRAHLDWTGSKWVRPEAKELSKSMFSPGTLVEVSFVIGEGEVSWVTALLVKEIEENKVIVKICDKYLRCSGDDAKPTMAVDSHCVRPTPPPFEVEEYDLLDSVEVFHGSSWRQGRVMAVYSGKLYKVSLEATKDKDKDCLKFKHSNLRPFKVWRDGVWHSGPNQNPKTLAASGGLGKKKAPPVITSKVTSIEEDDVSSVTPLKQTEARAEGEKSPEKTLEPTREQNCLGGSTRERLPEEENRLNSKDGSRKRQREEEHNSQSQAEITDKGKKMCNDDDQPLSTELSSYQSPNVVYDPAAVVEETPAKYISPFAKKSPFWKAYETHDLSKTAPQSPHFSPLFDANEDIREWSAVGMMVTFYGLLNEVKDLHLDVSSSKLSRLSTSFAKLEKHGFNVTNPQSRISKVLSLQAGRAKKVEERKCLEEKIEAEEMERQKVEEEMAELERKRAELERKILELKRQEVVAKEKKEAVDKMIAEMKSCAETIDQEIEDVEIEFQTTL